MQRRKKVGGIIDRRFGENDPTMTPEEKALERFVKEKQRRSKGASLFDLEDDDNDLGLTHGGRSLSFEGLGEIDGFKEANSEDSEDDRDDDFLQQRPSKRRRLSDPGSMDDSEGNKSPESDGGQAKRPKTKKEVMEEVIAKSKLHRYERQQAKEDDDDLRAELDKGLPDLFALMRGKARASPQPPPQPQNSPPPDGSMNPDRLALLNGKDRMQADKEYDERLRQMAMDQRAKPTVRTLTEEEKAYQEAQRLKLLEIERTRRMRGEPDDSKSEAEGNDPDMNGNYENNLNEDNAFGLGSGLLGQNQLPHLGVEDEDEFIIEDEFPVSTFDIDASRADSEQQESESNGSDDDEFVHGLLSRDDAGREGLISSREQGNASKSNVSLGDLAYAYNCPQTHDEFLSVTKDVAAEDLPAIVQRIRALYHPKLSSENKVKLESFATVLVEQISYMACRTEHPPFTVLEALIRHIHSLAKSFPESVGGAFRAHLKAIHEQQPDNLNPEDLIILTAIGSIFPTSDHYHQVVAPAMLCMARYLGNKVPTSLSDLATGTYTVTLCLQYQHLSKRYVPEAVNYILNVLWALSPIKPKQCPGAFPYHVLPEALRIQGSSQALGESSRLKFWHVLPSVDFPDEKNQDLKLALLDTCLSLIECMKDLWSSQPAFCEVFSLLDTVLRFFASKPCRTHLPTSTISSIQATSSSLHAQLQTSLSNRRPLRLHNHRPLAIKTSIPKFEDSYNPLKHYDPNRDRAEMSKLKAEHKRERKGALRELRKDASFVARESLREKKERDAAYEKKQRRLINEIQGEEGREANSYEREKRMRKGRR